LGLKEIEAFPSAQFTCLRLTQRYGFVAVGTVLLRLDV